MVTQLNLWGSHVYWGRGGTGGAILCAVLALEKYDPALVIQLVPSSSAAAVMGWTWASVSSSRHFAVPPRRKYNSNNSRRRHGPRVGAPLLPHNANTPGRNASSDVINCANSDGAGMCSNTAASTHRWGCYYKGSPKGAFTPISMFFLFFVFCFKKDICKNVYNLDLNPFRSQLDGTCPNWETTQHSGTLQNEINYTVVTVITNLQTKDTNAQKLDNQSTFTDNIRMFHYFKLHEKL